MTCPSKSILMFLYLFSRCSACDSIFPSLMSLEHHKEEFEHWSEEDDDILTESDDDEDDTVISEECERLL